MAAGGQRIESNQFAIDVPCFTFYQRYKNELSATSNLGRRFLTASISIDILSLPKTFLLLEISRVALGHFAAEFNAWLLVMYEWCY